VTVDRLIGKRYGLESFLRVGGQWPSLRRRCRTTQTEKARSRALIRWSLGSVLYTCKRPRVLTQPKYRTKQQVHPVLGERSNIVTGRKKNSKPNKSVLESCSLPPRLAPRVPCWKKKLSASPFEENGEGSGLGLHAGKKGHWKTTRGRS